MKKSYLFTLYFIWGLAVCSADSKFISIPKTKRIIGNDAFSYIEKVFTGVAGEKGSGERVYLCKEHEVELDEYEIQKYLITNEEYNLFRKETGYKTEYELIPGTKDNPVLKNIVKKNFPVRRINFMYAVAYAQWRSDKDKKNDFRLPTNAEWENAAIDTNKNLYPWGNSDKVLASTMTDSETNRYEFPVDAIKEDCSYSGLCNTMGGDEYTLDLYNERFYENSPKENPLCFDGIDFYARGIETYNRMYEDQMGLYELSSGGFDSFSSTISFRLVKDKSTVFNRGTSSECIYYLNRANPKNSSLEIYASPDSKEKSDASPIKDLYILFKTTDNQFYRVYYCIEEFIDFINKYEYRWHYGWVKAEDILLNNKKWYEQ